MIIIEGDHVRVKLRIVMPKERQHLVLDDPLPAGLEAIDLSLRTMNPMHVWDSPTEYRDHGEDGKPLALARWQLAAGADVIAAVWPDGARNSVRVTVQ